MNASQRVKDDAVFLTIYVKFTEVGIILVARWSASVMKMSGHMHS